MKISKYYRKFLRRKLNKKNQLKLNNHSFSLIASNCVGGVITHELGMRFDSPTVNLFFYPEDYLKLLSNFKYYIQECSLVQDIKLTLQNKYPVGKLDDIVIHFVHYRNFEEAKHKWETRCSRIHWDNLYFMMVERDGCTEEQVRKFDELPYEHKIIFTKKRYPEIRTAYFIENSLQENGEVKDWCLYKNKFTGVRAIDGFDYVEFVNQV